MLSGSLGNSVYWNDMLLCGITRETWLGMDAISVTKFRYNDTKRYLGDVASAEYTRTDKNSEFVIIGDGETDPCQACWLAFQPMCKNKRGY